MIRFLAIIENVQRERRDIINQRDEIIIYQNQKIESFLTDTQTYKKPAAMSDVVRVLYESLMQGDSVDINAVDINKMINENDRIYDESVAYLVDASNCCSTKVETNQSKQ